MFFNIYFFIFIFSDHKSWSFLFIIWLIQCGVMFAWYDQRSQGTSMDSVGTSCANAHRKPQQQDMERQLHIFAAGL